MLHVRVCSLRRSVGMNQYEDSILYVDVYFRRNITYFYNFQKRIVVSN